MDRHTYRKDEKKEEEKKTMKMIKKISTKTIPNGDNAFKKIYA